MGFLLLFIISIVHLTQGHAALSWRELLFDSWTNTRVQAVLLGVRLPRVAIGILAGGALAMAGLLLQTLTRNPLASAGTLGINAGAYLFVVLGAVFFPAIGATQPFFFAFFGAVFAAVLVFSLVGRGMEPVKVALTGMIVTLLLGALTSGVQLMFEQETNGLFLWGAGTLIQNNWSGVSFSWPFILCAGVLVVLAGQKFDLLLLGDEAAAGLGASVKRVKIFGWITAIVLASATVSVVGPIGFIGLIAPHIVRLLQVQGHRMQLIHSFVWGAFLLVAADVLARFIQPGSEIPVGAVTALIGGPWLMYLAYKMGKRYSAQKQTLGGKKSGLGFTVLLLSLFLLSIVIAVISLSYGGGRFYSISELASGMLWQQTALQFRWPRVLVAFMIGAMLALCGALLQSVLRNPLGDPSVLGITSGGGAGALAVMVLIPSLPFAFVPVGAVIGAGAAIGIILLATKRSGWEPISLALMGVAVSAVGSGIIQILTVKASVGVAPVLLWLAGSTYAMSWSDTWLTFTVLACIFPLSFLMTKQLDVLALSNDISVGLGLRVQLVRVFALLLAVTIGAASVAVVGAIGFIGLLAPHAARGIVGIKTRHVLPASMAIGGTLLITADFLSRFLLYPKEIPSGLLVALIGAPYILYIMRKMR